MSIKKRYKIIKKKFDSSGNLIKTSSIKIPKRLYKSDFFETNINRWLLRHNVIEKIRDIEKTINEKGIYVYKYKESPHLQGPWINIIIEIIHDVSEEQKSINKKLKKVKNG